MTSNALTPEPAWPFLLVRRGVPLALAGAALLASVGFPGLRGWMVLLAVACLAEVGPAFRSGESYLRNRAPIIRWDGFWVRAFRPLARAFGREEAWVLSFCAWNNRRVHAAFRARRARRAMILLPHCIQLSRCKADVITDLEACYRCGLCPVEDVLEGTLARRWETRLTNRSHKAYREAREYRPDLIVAVSCTDRLLKGLLRLPEIPCFVIPLALPHGMCVDTTFSAPRLIAAMEDLVEPRTASEGQVVPLRGEGIA